MVISPCVGCIRRLENDVPVFFVGALRWQYVYQMRPVWDVVSISRTRSWDFCRYCEVAARIVAGMPVKCRSHPDEKVAVASIDAAR